MVVFGLAQPKLQKELGKAQLIIEWIIRSKAGPVRKLIEFRITQPEEEEKATFGIAFGQGDL